MAFKITSKQPDQFNHFPDQGYTYFRLYNKNGEYGVAAVAEHDDALELHLELSRWGAQVRRSLARDARWLRSYAQKHGKSRIVGIKQESGEPDPRWPKFTRIFGFTGQTLLQTAFMEVDSPS